MVSRVHTVAFNGIDVLDIECQVQISSGVVAFNVVGLPDKAVAESRERVRGALAAMGLALPPRRITVNLAPADVLKEGSHFDLPIAAALPDLRNVKGQESAKRALEIAAAGGHNLLMAGPPGSGKSMLAARLPGLLPPLSPAEALELSMIHSVAGRLEGGRLLMRRPFRDPHHSATLPALIGGGLRARPGEVSLAHHGVLFLDELPEFDRRTLEALRQPLESGRAVVARANTHVTYPARFQLIAAMNPCKCGYLDDPALACSRAPRCAADYQSRISGPLFDRIDLHVDVPAVKPADLSLPPPSEGSAEVAARVAAARAVQSARYAKLGAVEGGASGSVRVNAHADGALLDAVAEPDEQGRKLLTDAAERLHMSARGWHRVLRVARTIADLDGSDGVRRVHIAEALSYRRVAPGQ